MPRNMWLLFSRMRFSVSIGEVTGGQQRIKIVALPFGEVGACIFKFALACIIFGIITVR